MNQGRRHIAEHQHSELRQDLVSGNWALVSPGRAKRPHKAVRSAGSLERITKATCPFEDLLRASGGVAPFVQYGGEAWRLAVIENKYPALSHGAICPAFLVQGPYRHLGAVGRHELVITRDHQKNFSQLAPALAAEVFSAAAERFRAFAQDACLAYAILFQNYGAQAGASQPHPHYQIITTPVTPPGVARSQAGASDYFAKHRRCAYCVMLSYERNRGERIVYENEHAIAFAPFASAYAYELRVFPKRHRARFEETPEAELAAAALALQKGLGALRKKLYDPDYNFLLHTAPLKGAAAGNHYHWHVEVMPRTQIFAGFEIGTGMVINPILPEAAAALLRKAV